MEIYFLKVKWSAMLQPNRDILKIINTQGFIQPLDSLARAYL